MSKKSEKTKAAVLEKAAQNLPTAPAPGQLPVPDAQGVWNPPPLRPMAKVAEPVRVGPKVDWNGEPREPGDAPTRVKEIKAGKLPGYPSPPKGTNTETSTPVKMPFEADKYSPSAETKVETTQVPNPGSEKVNTAAVPETVFKTAKTRGKKGSMLYATSFKKPPRKMRNPGVYEVFMHGKVQGSVSVGQSGILEIMIPKSGVYNTREDAEFAATAVAAGNPGKTVEVHRRLSRMTFEAITTTKLVRK